MNAMFAFRYDRLGLQCHFSEKMSVCLLHLRQAFPLYVPYWLHIRYGCEVERRARESGGRYTSHGLSVEGYENAVAALNGATERYERKKKKLQAQRAKLKAKPRKPRVPSFKLESYIVNDTLPNSDEEDEEEGEEKAEENFNEEDNAATPRASEGQGKVVSAGNVPDEVSPERGGEEDSFDDEDAPPLGFEQESFQTDSPLPQGLDGGLDGFGDYDSDEDYVDGTGIGAGLDSKTPVPHGKRASYVDVPLWHGSKGRK